MNRHFRWEQHGNSDTIAPIKDLPLLQFIVNDKDICLWHSPSAPQDRGTVWACVDSHSCIASWRRRIVVTDVFWLWLITRSNYLSTLPFQPWRRKRRRAGRSVAVAVVAAALEAAGRWLQRLRCPRQQQRTGSAEGVYTPPGYADPGAFQREGVGGRGRTWPRFGFPGGRLSHHDVDR